LILSELNRLKLSIYHINVTGGYDHENQTAASRDWLMYFQATDDQIWEIVATTIRMKHMWTATARCPCKQYTTAEIKERVLRKQLGTSIVVGLFDNCVINLKILRYGETLWRIKDHWNGTDERRHPLYTTLADVVISIIGKAATIDE